LVDNGRAYCAQKLSTRLRGKEKVEAFWRGDQNVWRTLNHGPALGGWGVAAADSRSELESSARHCDDATLGLVEVFVDVVAECFEGGHVQNVGFISQLALFTLPEKIVERPQESCQSRARAS